MITKYKMCHRVVFLTKNQILLKSQKLNTLKVTVSHHNTQAQHMSFEFDRNPVENSYSVSETLSINRMTEIEPYLTQSYVKQTQNESSIIRIELKTKKMVQKK